jgi:hypothetical protein
VDSLALKLLLTPALIGSASLAGRRLLHGLFAFASFFLVVASLIEQAGISVAFVAAVAVTLAVQGASLWILHRRRT